MELLNLSLIRRDGGTQTRAMLDLDTVDEYAERMENGEEFPPLVVFHDGDCYWLADGFHRIQAAENCAAEVINCDVRQGTRRDAILYSVGANAAHGLRRSNADKRRAVETLLHDEEWSKWSNRKIAQVCAVDEGTVRNYRESICGNSADTPRKVERNGTVYEQRAKKETISRTEDPIGLDDDEPASEFDDEPEAVSQPEDRVTPEHILERFKQLWASLQPEAKELIRDWLETQP